MTKQDRIINTVKKYGAITLQDLYLELPDIKKTVIRGTINRYVRRKDSEIRRAVRSVYVSVTREETTNILDFGKMSLRKKIDNLIKSKFISNNLRKRVETKYDKVVGIDGEFSSTQIQMDFYAGSSEYSEYSSQRNASVYNITTKEVLKDGLQNGEYPIEYFDNKVFNEDARTFLKKLPSDSIDLVVTDPPYKVTSRGIGRRTSTGGMMRSKLTCQGKIFEHNSINIKEYVSEFFRVLKDGSHCYIMTNQKNLVEMLNETIAAGFKFIKSLIWKKNNKGSGQFYMSQFEYILFFRKGKAVRINNCGTSDVLEFENKKTKKAVLDEQGNPILNSNGSVMYKNLHHTEKPVDLMKVLVENSSKAKERVLDCFSGIGSLALACKALGRTFICNEIDPNYRDITIDRINMMEYVY